MKNLLKFLKALGVIVCAALMLAFTVLIFSDIDTTGRITFIILDVLFAFLLILLLKSLKKKPAEKASPAEQTIAFIVPEPQQKKVPPAEQPATAFILSKPQPSAAGTV